MIYACQRGKSCDVGRKERVDGRNRRASSRGPKLEMSLACV